MFTLFYLPVLYITSQYTFVCVNDCEAFQEKARLIYAHAKKIRCDVTHSEAKVAYSDWNKPLSPILKVKNVKIHLRVSQVVMLSAGVWDQPSVPEQIALPVEGDE